VELRRKYRRALLPVVVGIAASLVLVAVVIAPAAKRQLNSWKLLPQPEQLTELYFSDAQSLPRAYRPGASQAVAFTVRNLEAAPRTYKYGISAQNLTNSAEQPLATGTFHLARYQTSAMSVAVILPELGDRAKITVSLMMPNISVDYLVKKESL
jgi:hypothetical protein